MIFFVQLWIYKYIYQFYSRWKPLVKLLKLNLNANLKEMSKMFYNDRFINNYIDIKQYVNNSNMGKLILIFSINP